VKAEPSVDDSALVTTASAVDDQREDPERDDDQGKVRIFVSGRSDAFSTPNTSAHEHRQRSPSKLTPGTTAWRPTTPRVDE